MRKTKIVCTIGPASESAEKLEELMLAGMNVARFNFSHGDYEEHRAKFERTVQIAEKLGLPVATMMDTKGPEIRLRDFEGGKVYLETGTIFALTTEEIMGTAQRATITYKNLKYHLHTDLIHFRTCLSPSLSITCKLSVIYVALPQMSCIDTTLLYTKTSVYSFFTLFIIAYNRHSRCHMFINFPCYIHRKVDTTM